jgi:hypothetical protein
MSPSDIVGPSPVTSTGTETTEIEDEEAENVRADLAGANPIPPPQVGDTIRRTIHRFIALTVFS